MTGELKAEERSQAELELEKRVEELERASANAGMQLRAIMDNVQAGVGLLELSGDDELTALYLSDGFYELAGVTAGQYEALAGSMMRAVHPDDRVRVKGAIIQNMRAGRPIDCTYRVLHKSGLVQWINMVASRIDYQGDARTVYSTILIDITQRREMERQLKINEERLRIAMNLTGTVAWDYDFSTRSIVQTEASMRHYGISKFISTDVPDSLIKMGLVHPDSEADLLDLYERLERGDRHVDAVLRMRMADGGYRWERVAYRTVFDENGQPYKAVGASEDISEIREAQLRFAEEEQRRTAVSAGASFSFDVDLTDDRIDDGVGAITARLDASPGGEIRYSELGERFCARIVHPDDAARVRRFLSRERVLDACAQGVRELSMEYRCLEEDGAYRWYATTMHLYTSAAKGHVCCILYAKDCDARKRRELLLEERAQHDSLTGLYNRMAFEQLVERAFQEDPHALSAMIMMDLDNFKRINDTFGHAYGDEVLAQIGPQLKRMFRADDVVGRIGGDEFAVFMRNLPSREMVRQRTQAMVDQISRTHVVDDEAVSLTCSAGVAFAPEHGCTFHELYRCSDKAQYKAKGFGKGRYEIYESMG